MREQDMDVQKLNEGIDLRQVLENEVINLESYKRRLLDARQTTK